ncbi:hypothetical protein ACIQZG_11885 [Lysinibacillus sp. NPDC096418]|uniref:hypothetical protein n=1 Tax=Lysinibacillus sp. NPDC096418 TaxID=3364138 RepID=UPI00380E4DA3
MKIKVIMDSGKEYILEYPGNTLQQFISSLYNENQLPMGAGTVKVLKNSFSFLDPESKIMFNPSHVSSIEIIN